MIVFHIPEKYEKKYFSGKSWNVSILFLSVGKLLHSILCFEKWNKIDNHRCLKYKFLNINSCMYIHTIINKNYLLF